MSINNMPGGRLIAGFGGQVLAKTIIGNTQYTTLNVAKWQLHRDIHTQKCAHSGTLGAIARRVTGWDWTVSLSIWYDIDNPPDMLLQTPWSVSIQLGLGSLAAWQAYGYNSQGYYASPSGLLTKLDVQDSSEGDEIVMANCTIEGNSRIFLLPNEQADYNNYIVQLQLLGQL